MAKKKKKRNKNKADKKNELISTERILEDLRRKIAEEIKDQTKGNSGIKRQC